MQRRDKVVLQKIINAIDVGLKVFNNISMEKFLNDDGMKLSMSMTIIRIGELVKNLSEEFRQKNSQIEWKAIAGFRDIAAHKYETLRMRDVYDTIKNELPELKLQIEKILEKKLKITPHSRRFFLCKNKFCDRIEKKFWSDKDERRKN